MDGTLIDSMQMWRSLPQRYLRSLGIDPEADVREKNKKRTFRGLIEQLRSCYGIEKSEDQIAREMMQEVSRFYEEEVQIKEGVLDFLQQLRDSGVKMCIATATDRPQAEIALKHCGLMPFFDRVFCCSEVGHGKNEPDIFRQALAHLGTGKEETVIFEDAFYAIRTAKADGFRIAAVFDPSEPRQEEIRSLAEVYLESYREAEEAFGLSEMHLSPV